MADVVSLQSASQSLLDEAGAQSHLPAGLALSRVITSLGAALHGLTQPVILLGGEFLFLSPSMFL